MARSRASASRTPHSRTDAEGYNLLVLSQWMDPNDNNACIAWARNSYAAMQPFMGSGRYVNYLGDDEQGDAVAAAYGPNYRRLAAAQGEIRSREFLPHEPEYTTGNVRPRATGGAKARGGGV